MEERCLGDEKMPIADEKKQPFREVPGSSRSVKVGFGPFLVKACEHLTLKTVEKLTTYSEFGDGVFDGIKKEELPGLSFLNELVSRGQISKDNISYLSSALDFIKCQGIRTKIEELYNQHCCADVIKNGEKVCSVSFQDGERAAKILKLNNTDPKPVVPQNAISKVTPMGRVLNMASGKIVPSVKGVLVKIRFQWVNFRSSGTILTLQDASHPFLTVIVDGNIESIKSTLPQLCEGDIIEVKDFRTKRSKEEVKTCYVLSEPRSTVRKVTDEHLQYVANQLPVLGCYQIRGICTYIQITRYKECAEVYCRGKKLRNSDMDPLKMMSCPSCERSYPPTVQKLGWFISLEIDDGSDSSPKDSCNPIIFKNTVTDILQKMKDKQGHKEVKNKSFRDIFHDKSVRAIVRPGNPCDVVMDFMLTKSLQRRTECDTDVTSREIMEEETMSN